MQCIQLLEKWNACKKLLFLTKSIINVFMQHKLFNIGYSLYLQNKVICIRAFYIFSLIHWILNLNEICTLFPLCFMQVIYFPKCWKNKNTFTYDSLNISQFILIFSDARRQEIYFTWNMIIFWTKIRYKKLTRI